jgi:hypothetical protein
VGVASLDPEVHELVLLVLLVNDSEHSKSAGAKPILSRGCIYLVSPGALRFFAAAAAAADFCCCCCALLRKKIKIKNR